MKQFWLVDHRCPPEGENDAVHPIAVRNSASRLGFCITLKVVELAMITSFALANN
jgi:hypothetical protein